jgi:hypothetical protein
MHASLESLGLSWSKNMLDKVQEWLDKSFRWQEQKKPVLSFSIKLTQLEEPDLMMVQEAIMKCKELCFKLSIKWTAFNPEVTLRF